MAAMPEVKTQNVEAFVNFLQTPSQTEICNFNLYSCRNKCQC